MQNKENFIPLLTIAGSDNSGGAGVQADLKTFSAFGCYGLSAITSVTAQTSNEFHRFETISPDLLGDQIDFSFRQAKPLGIKTGMIGSPENILAISHALKKWKIENFIIDPVLKSSAGAYLNSNDDEFVNAMKKNLIPLATGICPNRMEAERLSGIPISSQKDIETAAKRILELGCGFVMIKGGHLESSDETVRDFLITRERTIILSGEKIKKGNFHGTGCTHSSALLACVALGMSLEVAADTARRFVGAAMKQSDPRNPGILNHSCRF